MTDDKERLISPEKTQSTSVRDDQLHKNKHAILQMESTSTKTSQKLKWSLSNIISGFYLNYIDLQYKVLKYVYQVPEIFSKYFSTAFILETLYRIFWTLMIISGSIFTILLFPIYVKKGLTLSNSFCYTLIPVTEFAIFVFLIVVLSNGWFKNRKFYEETPDGRVFQRIVWGALVSYTSISLTAWLAMTLPYTSDLQTNISPQ